MKTLYLECNMGAAGDMLMAALLELHPDPQDVVRRLNALGIPGVKVEMQPDVKCGITGTHVSVTVHGQEEHSHDHDHAHTHEHSHDHDHDHEHDHAHTHEHSHDHDHEYAHTHEHSHDHDHDHAHAHEHSHDHDHEHDHAHTHEHSHDHDHDHAHAHEHSHDHDHEHSHSEGGHSHSGLHDIEHLVGHLALSDQVKRDVMAVYQLIAAAESKAHGAPIDQIHFHEVGTMDAVADIVGVCMLVEELAAEQIVASPIHVGSGQVRCAHGILPVPAPATAHILQGVPIYGGRIRGELCTPTGAALLKHFVSSFGPMPTMIIEKIGYGTGSKDFEAANCVRAMWGETAFSMDEVVELSCNIDDMTPEALGFVQQLLMEEGALDVYTTAIGMKKNRPGILLTCMCRRHSVDTMIGLIFKHTTTLGMRESVSARYALRRESGSRETAYGTVRQKTSSGWGVRRTKLEYEDLARIAREQGISLAEAAELVRE